MKIYSQRVKNNERFVFRNGDDISLERAAVSLLRYELAFGGQLTKGCSEENIEVETQVFSCRDTTTIRGPAEEMKPLWRLVALFKQGDQTAEQMADEWFKTAGANAGIPFYVVNMAPAVLGVSQLVRTMLAAICQPRCLTNEVQISDQAALGDVIKDRAQRVMAVARGKANTDDREGYLDVLIEMAARRLADRSLDFEDLLKLHS